MTDLSVAAVTGRFQPFHLQHLELVAYALELAHYVIIGVTNPDRRSLQREAASEHRHREDANPFSFFERQEMILASLNAARLDPTRYCVVPFPLDLPDLWEGYIPLDSTQVVRVFSEWEREKVRRLAAAGYPVEVLEGDPESRISATDIRDALADDKKWSHWVPAGTRQVLAKWGPAQLRRRLRGGLHG